MVLEASHLLSRASSSSRSILNLSASARASPRSLSLCIFSRTSSSAACCAAACARSLASLSACWSSRSWQPASLSLHAACASCSASSIWRAWSKASRDECRCLRSSATSALSLADIDMCVMSSDAAAPLSKDVALASVAPRTKTQGRSASTHRVSSGWKGDDCEASALSSRTASKPRSSCVACGAACSSTSASSSGDCHTSSNSGEPCCAASLGRGISDWCAISGERELGRESSGFIGQDVLRVPRRPSAVAARVGLLESAARESRVHGRDSLGESCLE